MGEKCPGILPKCRLPRYIYGSFTCRKVTTWDRRLYFPTEGRRAEDFFALKIRRLRPDVNPRTWIQKTSTLPLDHRSRVEVELYPFLTTALEGDKGSASRPGRSLPPAKTRCPIIQEDGWTPGPVWTGGEKSRPHRNSIHGPSSP